MQCEEGAERVENLSIRVRAQYGDRNRPVVVYGVEMDDG